MTSLTVPAPLAATSPATAAAPPVFGARIIIGLVGVLLAYLGDPLVDRLERWKLSRTLAVVVVFALFSLILLAAC